MCNIYNIGNVCNTCNLYNVCNISYVGNVCNICNIRNVCNSLQSRLPKQWQEAADAKFQSLIDNGTWELVELPRAGSQLD